MSDNSGVGLRYLDHALRAALDLYLILPPLDSLGTKRNPKVHFIRSILRALLPKVSRVRGTTSAVQHFRLPTFVAILFLY